jgi:hypothetical protein
MIDGHGTCTHWGYGVGNGKAVTWKKVAVKRSNTLEILDWSMLDKKNERVTLNDQRKSYCVEASTSLKEGGNIGRLFLYPSIKKTWNGNIRDKSGNGRGALLPIRTDFGKFSWKGPEPMWTKSDFFLRRPPPGPPIPLWPGRKSILRI